MAVFTAQASLPREVPPVLVATLRQQQQRRRENGKPAAATATATSSVDHELQTGFDTTNLEIEDGAGNNKRRKLMNGDYHHAQLLSEVVETDGNGKSAQDGMRRTRNRDAEGYIPIARFVLDLNYEQNDCALDSHDECELESSPSEVPVLLKSARLVPHAQTPNLEMCLTTVSEKKVILSDDIPATDPAIASLGEHLELAQSTISVDRDHKKPPLVCYTATLRCSADGRTLQLETTLLWRDTLELPGRVRDTAPMILSKYILEGQPEVRYNYCFWHSRVKNRGPQATWSPRDFYDNVHVPEDTPEASADIKCDSLQCTLYPFQRRAVRWLLRREGVEVRSTGQVVPLRQPHGPTDSLPTTFERFFDVNGNECFVSHLFMIVTRDLSDWHDAEKHLRGGILAEEMGLGKTVEMLSLICLHRRQLPSRKQEGDRDEKLAIQNGEAGPSGQNETLRESGATLIITPPAILEQWKQEIESHAPALRVFRYTGLQNHQKMSVDELTELIADYDIVLTTYNVLAREVHFAGVTPQKTLRHPKKFERKKTPLVRISWWRVCLDEAQMIESGVSNAAKVAQMIPRQMAWAVTGTPLRKDMGDLFGLLLFLQYAPLCDSLAIWINLASRFKSVMRKVIGRIALRHSKDHIRDELRLPPQRRVVITVPFTAVEEQHYGQLFEQMCRECGLDTSGGPLDENWSPDDPLTIERMRNWLTRLRQTCLHPEVARKNRRALGTGSRPLRSVDEVLEVMIDQNDMLIRAEERAVLLSQLRRGQLLENAKRNKEALELWLTALNRASEIVDDCRRQLHAERQKARSNGVVLSDAIQDVDTGSENEADDEGKNSRVGILRRRLRDALEVQHICKFFTGNAYFQIKSNPKWTEPDSDEYKALERREEDAYEAAKLIRKEMLNDVSRRVGRYIKSIRERWDKKLFVHIPEMKPHLYSKGLETYRLFNKFEDFCEALNRHATQYNEWRDVMVKLLIQGLIDQEEEAELKGNEYETSTKHQDEMYVYMESLRALFADRTDALTGTTNVLIAHEVKCGIVLAQRGDGPSPKLFLSIMETRSKLKPDPDLGSLRGIISELRSLATSLEWQESGGSSRARAELDLVKHVLLNASQIANEQAKVLSQLEREVELFRETMNNRLAYYRQLQLISDTVAPFDEESAGKPLDEDLFNQKLVQESVIEEKISSLKAKHRYLIHLRDEFGSDESPKICVVCQMTFEIGVLTVCGHKYCKDCLRMWWRQHRTCPICKRRLKINDFHQITYKPQELVVQEEKPLLKLDADADADAERPSRNSIYMDMSSGMLQQIKNIDLEASYGTKIDTLARHLKWLRLHDPGAKSIVFSQYKHFLGVLGSAFSRFNIGCISVDHKDGIERFKSDPAIECFLLHAKAHSSGLNLINATHVFLCEPLINTAIELQAIARVHRIGQHSPTTVWMYLVSDTVEESIYDISVSRRLAHIRQRQKDKTTHRDHLHSDVTTDKDNINGTTTPIGSGSNNGGGGDGGLESLTEVAIDSANSLEMQDATLAKLMAGGASGGELVPKDDLWQCLYGSAARTGHISDKMAEGKGEVGRFLRGEAAEERRAAVTAAAEAAAAGSSS